MNAAIVGANIISDLKGVKLSEIRIPFCHRIFLSTKTSLFDHFDSMKSFWLQEFHK
jgi:hypothetical protein